MSNPNESSVRPAAQLRTFHRPPANRTFRNPPPTYLEPVDKLLQPRIFVGQSHDRRLTTATALLPGLYNGSHVQGFGIARLAPGDRFDEHVGQTLAISRALQNLSEALLLHLEGYAAERAAERRRQDGIAAAVAEHDESCSCRDRHRCMLMALALLRQVGRARS